MKCLPPSDCFGLLDSVEADVLQGSQQREGRVSWGTWRKQGTWSGPVALCPPEVDEVRGWLWGHLPRAPLSKGGGVQWTTFPVTLLQI